MPRGYLYIVIMLLSVMFMYLSETIIHPFPFHESGVKLSTYAWRHLVYIQLIAQIGMSLYDSHPSEILENKAYLIFMVYDWVDFAAICNQPYGYIGSIPVTANEISLLGFTFVFVGGQVKTRHFK